MSKADEMFSKIDFEKKEALQYIRYYINLPIWKPSITFYRRNKTIKVDCDIHIEELKAINEKVKELGWE